MATKIGITGGIGSGKSVVSRLLEVMGVPVYIADIEARRLMDTDAVIRRELITLVGKEVYVGNTLNRPFLASYLFASPDHALQINAIVHPRVKADFLQWVCTHATCPIVGMEAAILYESGFAAEVDDVAMVYAPLELRIQRAMKRDHSSREQIEARVRSQMNDEEKCQLARFVIVNDGEVPLLPQVQSLLESVARGK